MKVSLFYGHAASNLGDLAINRGVINLLRQAFDPLHLNVVLPPFGSDRYVDAMRASFGPTGNVDFTPLPKDASPVDLITDPEQFLAASDSSDADLVLVNAGEFLFSHAPFTNQDNLIWRTLPIFAAKTAGKKAAFLPSTFGPFADPAARALATTMFGIADGVAVREERTRELLARLVPAAKLASLPDPAFFVDPPEMASKGGGEGPALGIAMRLETWGIRVPAESRMHALPAELRESPAAAFSIELGRAYLAGDAERRLCLIVQTEADAELAAAAARQIDAEDRISIERPATIESYLCLLAGLEHVVATRFHALIMALLAGRPTSSVHFARHGHKIPGLHEQLGLPGSCLDLDLVAVPDAVATALADIERIDEAAIATPLRKVGELRETALTWLRTLPCGSPESEALDEAEARLLQHGSRRAAAKAEWTAKQVLQERDKARDEAERMYRELEDARAERDRAVDDAEKVRKRLKTSQTERDRAVDDAEKARKRLKTSQTERDRAHNDAGKALRELALAQIERDKALDDAEKARKRLKTSQTERDRALKRVKSLSGRRAALRQLAPEWGLSGYRAGRAVARRLAGRPAPSPARPLPKQKEQRESAPQAAQRRPPETLDPKALERLVQNRPARYSATPSRIAYVLHNSLPYASGGYATRGHGLATGLAEHGWSVTIFTRPGFPVDTNSKYRDVKIPPTDTIEGIDYVRNLDFTRRSKKLAYVVLAADAYESLLRSHRPDVVMAASFATWTGLPALIASRRLGIPFVYEVRGLSEVTKISREPSYGDSIDYRIERDLETLVCRHADAVFTLTGAMRDELVSRGVPAERIDLVPNSCRADRFLPVSRDLALAEELAIPRDVAVIGYVGTLVDYEGLDYLARACAVLKGRGREFRLLVVGSEHSDSLGSKGAISSEIARIAEEGGYADWLILTGRVPHQDVERYYSLIDIAPFPRLSWPVTEMVSPMKPLEAMAMEKAVVVSSVGALQEMITDGETGRIFAKDDADALADTLDDLLGDPEMRAALGRAARRHVEDERTWTKTGRAASDLLRQVASGVRQSPRRKGSSDILPPKGRSLATSAEGVTAVDFAQRRLEADFARRATFLPLIDWTLSPPAQSVRSQYVEKFGEKAETRVPIYNWKRADFSLERIGHAETLLDIGPGIGEFVNLLAISGRVDSVRCIDLRDYSLYTDLTGTVDRRFVDLFDLPPEERYEVVTCFEVIEHLPTERVAEAVARVRGMATRMAAFSVPLKEVPLSKYHRTTFDERLLTELFPDGEFFVLSKDKYKNVRWLYVEVPGGAPEAVSSSAPA